MSATKKRKLEHVEIAVKKDVQFKKSAGFSEIELVHNSLPELDFSKIDASANFLGKMLSAPLVLEAMTGGYPEGGKINRKLAEVAEKEGIALGLGSQRAMIEDSSLAKTYSVRDVAPTIPIIGNIGAYQLKKYPMQKIESMVSAIKADALAVHLNPLQEIIQPEGDRDYSGILEAIEKACSFLSVPVIVKETGCGISRNVAERLKSAGVKYLDIAGAGGTSWSAIEYARGEGVTGFCEWGIPTVASVIANRDVLPLIASGGLRSGIDAAKSIALGASFAGAAQPFLHAYSKNKLSEEVKLWKEQFAVCMFLTGSRNVESLKKAKIFIPSSIREYASQL